MKRIVAITLLGLVSLSLQAGLPDDGIIKTKRCILRPATVEDCPDILKYYALKDVSLFDYPEPWTVCEELSKTLPERISQEQANYATENPMFEEDGLPLRLAVVLTDSESPHHNCVIGHWCYYYLDESTDKSTMEFGVVFNPDVWRQGYATETGKALLAYIFTHWSPVQKISTFLCEDNKASKRCMEKLGMRFDKATEDDAEKDEEGNKITATVGTYPLNRLYTCAITRDQWKEDSRKPTAQLIRKHLPGM